MERLLYAMLAIVIFLVMGYLVLCYLSMGTPSIRLIYRTLGRDIRTVILYLKMVFLAKKCHFLNQTVVDLFHKRVSENPDNVCFVFEDEEWTYKKVNELSNKVAHCFRQQGYKKGDEVALLMENCPDYVCFWLGLAKIGVVTALININHKSESLAHSLNVINMKGLIFGQSLSENLQTAIPYIDKKDTATFYCYTRKSESEEALSFTAMSLNVLLEDADASNLDSRIFKTNFEDRLVYIYTSGTTGLPKAAIFRHSRLLWMSGASRIALQVHGRQTFYNTLPMYHLSGGIVYLLAVLAFGDKMVLRKKFSASHFWKEVVQHKVTVCQYIGEICRYLLMQPETPEETQLSDLIMFGNGLRPQIWKEFEDRFKVKKIIEVYGSTEGNTALVNFFGRVGAVGFIFLLFHRLYPVFLIKINPETGEILRDKNGLCICCKPGEPGELVGKVIENNPLNAFDGYLNANETNKKIIRDCIRKGDKAFLTGDILVMDEDGYLYFKDRSGDTYRWKGENVSTSEVESIVSKVLSLATCIVYGVEIPGTEGRAGMAAVRVDLENIHFEELFKDISEKLPTYAIPIFIRITSHIEDTGTYKLRKVIFQNQGFNPEEVEEPLFVLDRKMKTYIPLTKGIYSDIVNGKIIL